MSESEPIPRRPLDDVDLRIVGLLGTDARLSHREIARRIGMSPGAISERIDRLERMGVIRGYHADIDPVAIGLMTDAMIGLQVTQGHSVAETMAALYALPQVSSVSMVTGQWDFIVEVHVRDQEHLREVLIDHIWQLPAFRHSETLMVLQRHRRPDSWFVADGADPNDAAPNRDIRPA